MVSCFLLMKCLYLPDTTYSMFPSLIFIEYTELVIVRQMQNDKLGCVLQKKFWMNI